MQPDSHAVQTIGESDYCVKTMRKQNLDYRHVQREERATPKELFDRCHSYSHSITLITLISGGEEAISAKLLRNLYRTLVERRSSFAA